MRRFLLAVAVLLAPLAASAQSEPHAWLYGAWSGGHTPPVRGGPPATCLAQPSVIFTRDIILHTTLLDPLYQQRIIETVRATPNGVEIRLRPVQRSGGPLGATAGVGFGCGGDPNLLRVQRLEGGEIAFPGCVDFPSPLVSCAGH
ncbi:hypothetical protein [Elioraea tepidiphila]|uniref:hypothetical protein n=1 Tax=Elioraea tepidiphila TaxID=457934 RepID=UPI0003687BAB|nr:hypothetical protein [Elioraea tepidiphila]